MAIDPGVFRAYDIRGKAGSQLTVELAELLGRAFGTYVQEHEGGSKVAAGRDNRLSGEELKGALMRGLVSTGCTVYDIGMSTSPALYYAVGHWGLPGGVNVTGSHNPPDENGFKLVGVGNRPIAGEEVQDVRRLIEAGTFRSGEGKIVERAIMPEYFARLREVTKLTRRFRVAIDTGNGVAGLYNVPALRELGCDVVELYTDLDPTYPNHLPDPQMPENTVDLQKKVVETGCDLGLAFDGDGDRLGVVDEKGGRLDPDHVLILLARGLLEQQPGALIIVDIKSSQAVLDDIEAHGGRPVVWKTGHSFIKVKMREDGAPLGGEASGHMFYQDNFFADDAMYAACRLMTYISSKDMPLSQHLAGLPRWYTSPEVRVPCPDDRKWDVVAAVSADLRAQYPSSEIDGIRITLPDGWALVRASNTGPNLTMRYESKTQEGLDRIEAVMRGALGKHVEVPATLSSGH